MTKSFKFSALLIALSISILNGCGESTPKKETSSEQVTTTDSIPEKPVETPPVTNETTNSTPVETQIVEKKPETSSPKPATPVKKTEQPSASEADIAKGKVLLTKSDCMACHKIDVKVVGPAYVDVARKYPATESNYNRLVKKIIEGGGGVWGEIPMSPHPTLSESDAKKMAKYILSLK